MAFTKSNRSDIDKLVYIDSLIGKLSEISEFFNPFVSKKGVGEIQA